MPEKWTGDLVGKMHVHHVSCEELAKQLGHSKAYVSMILNGKRTPKTAQIRFVQAFQEILQERTVSREEN